jgi:hypothetical protein
VSNGGFAVDGVVAQAAVQDANESVSYARRAGALAAASQTRAPRRSVSLIGRSLLQHVLV